jgi:hypothetical protein
MVERAIQCLGPALLFACLLSWLARKSGLVARCTAPRAAAAAVLVAAFIVASAPWLPGGLPVSAMIAGVNPIFSVTGLVLMTVWVAAQSHAKALLNRADLLGLCLWVVAVSAAVFASSLGFVSYDLYARGYHFSWFFWLTAAVTVALSLAGRIALAGIGVGTIAAYCLRLLPSPNFFDYITDGLTALMALSYLICRVAGVCKGMRAGGAGGRERC